MEKLEVKLFVSIYAPCFEARCWGLSSGFCFIVMAIDVFSEGHSIGNNLLGHGLNKEGEGRLRKAIALGPLLHALGYLESLEMLQLH